jgi:YesN/AraC family two-component response regulator
MQATILVVDDEPEVEHLIRQRFKPEIDDDQYRFLFALSGNAGLQLIKDHPTIDLVLTDINMPGMDGFEFLRQLRQLNQNSTSIMVSAYGSLPHLRSSMKLGARDFIAKPINFQELRETITAILTDKAQTHQVDEAQKMATLLEAARKNNGLVTCTQVATFLNCSGTLSRYYFQNQIIAGSKDQRGRWSCTVEALQDFLKGREHNIKSFATLMGKDPHVIREYLRRGKIQGHKLGGKWVVEQQPAVQSE